MTPSLWIVCGSRSRVPLGYHSAGFPPPFLSTGPAGGMWQALRIPGGQRGDARPPQDRRRLRPQSRPLLPPENKRDIQQWPVAARATPLGKFSVEAACTVIAFKSAPPARRAHPDTWAAPRLRAHVCVLVCVRGRERAGKRAGSVRRASLFLPVCARVWALVGATRCADRRARRGGSEPSASTPAMRGAGAWAALCLLLAVAAQLSRQQPPER